MPRILRTLLSGLSFAAFSIGSGALGFVILPVVRRLSPTGTAAVRARDVVSAGLRFFLWMTRSLRLLQVTTVGAVDARPPGAFVLIANHPTLLDTVVLLAKVRGIQAIAKHTWAETPLIGSVVSRAGYLLAPNPSADPAGTTPVLDQMVARLRAGEPLLVFPEGTRSPPGDVHRFRRGGLEAARRAGVPVWPVLLTSNLGTPLSHQRWWQVPDRRVELTVAFQEPFEVPEDTPTVQLTRQMRADYKQHLAGDRPAAGGHQR